MSEWVLNEPDREAEVTAVQPLELQKQIDMDLITAFDNMFTNFKNALRECPNYRLDSETEKLASWTLKTSGTEVSLAAFLSLRYLNEYFYIVQRIERYVGLLGG